MKVLSERYNLHLPVDRLPEVREDISDQLDDIAKRMRIQRKSAKRYVTDEWIAAFAEHIASVVQRDGEPKPHVPPALRVVE